MSVTIRQARESDLPTVLTLYAQPGVDDGVVLSVEEARHVFKRFSAYPDYRLFVAEHQGEVVGSYALLIMDNLGHLGAPSAVIEDVVVDPDFQGAGIGRAMMRHAMTEARIKGCYKASLSANLKRERAHAFYEAVGFERHGYSFLTRLEETV
jgi:ribosomal protein S18 acetylase RimI-like enzyme